MSISELKNDLKNNTLYMKAFFFFEPDCGLCALYLSKNYKEIHNYCGDSISFYFITANHNNKQYCKSLLKSIGIRQGFLIYLKDTEHSFIDKNNSIDISRILDYLFNPAFSLTVLGFPISMITDRYNHLKVEKVFFLDDTIIRHRPIPWHVFIESRIEGDYSMEYNDSVRYLDFSIND